MCIRTQGITLSLFFALAACHSIEDHRWTPLTDSEAWAPTDSSQDPLVSHRPEQVDCEAPGWSEELGAIEVDTGACNYLSLSQPALVELERGDELHASAWWQTLANVEPAAGHLAIYAGTDLLWEEEIPIPGPADARELSIPARRNYPAGTPITLHLHNHGTNTWNFETISVRR